MCACINYEKVRMDYVFIPPPPFFEGTRAEFDTALEDCWYGRVVLLFRIRVKLDKKDGNGRSVRMDCDCAISSVSATLLRAGARVLVWLLVCIKSAVCLQNVCK